MVMNGDSSIFSAQIDAVVDRVREHWNVPGGSPWRRCVAPGRRAYGNLDQETSVRADADSGFAIGSCSKAFTAALAATRVDRGELGWDDPIRKFLPQFQLYDPCARAVPERHPCRRWGRGQLRCEVSRLLRGAGELLFGHPPQVHDFHFVERIIEASKGISINALIAADRPNNCPQGSPPVDQAQDVQLFVIQSHFCL
jgi:Beta-lactamase